MGFLTATIIISIAANYLIVTDKIMEWGWKLPAMFFCLIPVVNIIFFLCLLGHRIDDRKKDNFYR